MAAFVAQFCVTILIEFLKRSAQTEQELKDVMQFIEIMDRKGLVSVQMRLKAVNQIDRVKQMWAAEEAKNEAKP